MGGGPVRPHMEYMLDNSRSSATVPLWDYQANRKGDFERHAKTIEIFHHPRHLMENIVMLENLARHNGKSSGIFG